MIKLHQLLIGLMFLTSLTGGFLYIFNDASVTYDKSFESEELQGLNNQTTQIANAAEDMADTLTQPERIGFNLATFQAFGSGGFKALLLIASTFSNMVTMIAVGVGMLPFGSFGNLLVVSLTSALLIWIFLGVVIRALLGDSSRL